MQGSRETQQTVTEEFGPYAVFERLGLGGMATVHRAKKRGIEGFERVVALKRLLPHLAEDGEFVKSFVREAKLASLLMHANIVQIYELGRVGGVYFISMEHVEGFDVRKILRQARRINSPPPVNVVLTVMAELCEALDYAHSFADEQGTPLGIVHRDVSPSNLIVSRTGHLKVIDFGIAKATSQQLRTQTGRVKGKLGYMSPEAAMGKTLDARSDLFSAGVIFHELLTARPLFASKTDFETLEKIQKTEPAPPSRGNSQIPPEVDAVVLKALAKNADERFLSAGELRAAIDDLTDKIGARFSNRDVHEWTQWAFSQEVAPSEFGARTSGTWQRVSASPVGLAAAAQGTPIDRSPEMASGPIPVRPAFGVNTPIPRRVSSVRTALPLPAPPAAEEDVNVVDLAWGGAEAGAPVVLDEVPDVSGGVAIGSVSPVFPAAGAHAARVSGAQAPVPAPVASDFGAALVDRAASQARWWKYALAAGVVALLGVVAILLLTRSSGKPTTAAPEVSKPARVNFVVQPADATIEVGGQIASKQSPFEAELEPGLYTIAIRREGYKSWITDLAVQSGERQRIQVALEKGGSAQARFMIKSNPEGLAVELDGKPLDQRTPVSVDVSPGFHRIVVKDDHGQEWSEEITAEVDTQYQLQAVMGAKEQRDREQQKRLASTRRDEGRALSIVGERTAPEPAPEQPAKPIAGLNTGIAPTVLDTAPVSAPAPVATPEPDPEPPPAAAAPPAAPPPVATTAQPPPPKPTPAPAPPPAKKKAAKIVPPTAVTKVSGTMPKIEAKIRGKNVSGDVVAKVCIDESGRVSSVDVARAAPEIKDQVRSALETWRYKPYLEGGAPTPACFGLMMKVKIEELE